MRLTTRISNWITVPVGAVCLLASAVLSTLLMSGRPAAGALSPACRDGITSLILLSAAVNILLLVFQRTYRREMRARRRVEAELRASEARFRGLFENVPDGVYQTSIAGKIIAANPALVRMLGFQAEGELKQVEIARDLYVQPEQRALLAARMDRDGFLKSVEIELKRRDGETITVLENGRAVRGAGSKLAYYEGTLTDITSLKKAQQDALRYTRQVEEARRMVELQARQLLEQSFELADARDAAVQNSRLKSEFLASLGQAVQTSLGEIGSAVGSLAGPVADARQVAAVASIRRWTESLHRLVEEALEFGRLESADLKLCREPFSLRRLVEESVEAAAAEAEARNLVLASLINKDVPDAFVGDPDRIRRVFETLVRGALQGAESGEVIVTVTTERETAAEVQLRFQIEDTEPRLAQETLGPGPPPFPSPETGDDRFAGLTGLGVSAARRIVERMGGEMGARTEPGQSSLVWFLVRLRKHFSAPREADGPAALGGRRILIVEDVTSLRGILQEQCRGWGMEPVAAGSAGEALNCWRAVVAADRPFDFVLIDYDFADSGSAGLLGAVLDEPVACPPRVLLVIPHSLRDQAGEPLFNGIHGVVAKPVGELRLRETLEAALGPAAESPLAASS